MTPNHICQFVRNLYQSDEFIPLHAPTFTGNEKQYVIDTIESTFVSSVGQYVDKFETAVAKYTGAQSAIAVVNGTAALHTAMYVAGVQRGDLVITQSLTFVATCNAIFHLGAEPVFIDVDQTSLGLCPHALASYLSKFAAVTSNGCIHKLTGQPIRAVIPMHTFGHPVALDELMSVCQRWNLTLIEDAAESFGSFYKNKHTGTVGDYAAISFNGNKIITTGGGGIVLCSDKQAGARVKHVTTTAKVAHAYEFFHDEPGFNFRMPNLNAALGCAQLERIVNILEVKRQVAESYRQFFYSSSYRFIEEPAYAKSNYWLNAVLCKNKHERDHLLNETNQQGVMTRPVWTLMHKLPMFSNSLKGDLAYSEYLSEHLVNLPSTAVETKVW